MLSLRDVRPRHDPWQYQDLIVEDERTDDGRVARVGTVLLTGRECPWRCVMCDLWRGTTADDTPRGAIPAQIAKARRHLVERHQDITQLKLYNAGSFFDPRAVPEDDYGGIAGHLAGLDRVIVESHPALVEPRVDAFLAALAGGATPRLEVAMGLETVHSDALDKLNKRMTVDDFVRAAGLLRQRDVALRTFLLIAPPGVPQDEQDSWLSKSVDTALACGATAVSLVPTRGGNGALEALAAAGAFREPRLGDIERSVSSEISRATRLRSQGIPSSYSLARRSAMGAKAARGSPRVFVDLWDLERFSDCAACFQARRARLHTMNLEQRVLPSVSCDRCHS